MVTITGKTLEVSGWWGANSGSGGGPVPHDDPWWKKLWKWLKGKKKK